MSQIALAQEPLDITIARMAQSLTAKEGVLATVSLRIRTMTLCAMVRVDERTRCRRLRLAGEWINTFVIFRRDVIPMRVSGRKCKRDGCDKERSGAASPSWDRGRARPQR